MTERGGEAALGRHSAGVWTRASAERLGVTPERVRGLTDEGAWQTVHRGVHADGGIVLDAQQRAWAAVLAVGPDATAAGRTAARLWGLPLVDDDDPATGRHEADHDDVLCPRALRDRPRLHPVRAVLPVGERRGLGGCPVTTPLRTLWDLTALLRPDAHVCALDAALHRGLVDASGLERERLRRRRHPGVGVFGRAVALADGRAESPLETLGRLALLPVLPSLVPQVEVRSPGGVLLARVDLGDLRARFAVEGDGRRGHEGPVMVRKDRAREAGLSSYGWRVERFGWADVRCHEERLRARVLRAWQQHAAGRR